MQINRKISVIIPCFNGKDFIKDTIHSVLNQTYTNFEIIVVNDGSTDNSVEIVQAFNEERISIIHKENSGVSDSRNLGFQKAKGEFVIFLDADDLLSENFFEAALKTFKEDISIDFLTVDISNIDENNKPIASEYNYRGTYKNVQNEVVSFKINVSTCPSAYIYRKEQLQKHKIYFNKTLSSPADRYFLLEIGAYLKGGFISDAPLKYRVHPNSMSHLKSKKLVLDQENFLRHTLQENILKNNADVSIFKRKLYYQLFVDFLKLKQPLKAFKYGYHYLTTYINSNN